MYSPRQETFAFVLMMNESDAEGAIDGLNGGELWGRELEFNGWKNSGRSGQG